MDHGALPADVALVRTTDEFTAVTVPRGLLRSHRIAPGVWGRLRVHGGGVRFLWEGDGDELDLAPGDSVVIPPDTPHRVRPGLDARFLVEFHR